MINHKFKMVFVILLFASIILVIGCSSAPSSEPSYEVIKKGAVWSCCNQHVHDKKAQNKWWFKYDFFRDFYLHECINKFNDDAQIKNLKITNKYTRQVNDKIYYVYDFELTFQYKTEEEKTLFNSVAVGKIASRWFYRGDIK